MDAREAVYESSRVVASMVEPVRDDLLEMITGFGNYAAAAKSAFGDDLGGGTRCGGAKVSHEIADGEVDFVADGRDDGNRGRTERLGLAG